KQISDPNCSNTFLSTVWQYGTPCFYNTTYSYLLWPISFSLSSNQRSFHSHNSSCLHDWTLSDKEIVLTFVSSISLM
ncbi:hypothetical protein N305_00274, partial [Manacus vitellinus]